MDKKRILVVDDEENTRRLMQIALTNAGFEVLQAENGLKALEIIQKEIPDAVIVDIVMPEMDGRSLLREIRKIPEVKDIPVVISSGKDEMKKYFEIENIKYESFLNKPYKIKILVETVKNLFKNTDS